MYINTCAPRAQSSHLVSSFGEWLIPATLGTKIIPIGPASPSPARRVPRRWAAACGFEPELARRRFDGRLHLRRSQRRIVVRRRLHLDLRLRLRRDLARLRLNLLAQPPGLGGVQVAQLHHQPYYSRHDVRRVRRHVQLSDRPHLPARLAPHHVVHRDHQVRCRHQRILPLRHRRSPGVIGETAHLDVVAVDAHDAFHHADIQLRLLERPALLDMQLDI